MLQDSFALSLSVPFETFAAALDGYVNGRTDRASYTRAAHELTMEMQQRRLAPERALGALGALERSLLAPDEGVRSVRAERLTSAIDVLLDEFYSPVRKAS